MFAKFSLEPLTGIPEIDQRHRQLVAMLNEAYQGFVVGINIDELFISDLIYAMAHCFDLEESWMINNSYPEYAVHKKEHAVFTRRLLVIRSNYRHDAKTSVDLLVFLNNFISHHVQQVDSRLGISGSLAGPHKQPAAGIHCSHKPGGDAP